MSPIGSRLSSLTRDLIARWKQTKEDWTDIKSREFEQKHLVELESNVETAITVIEQMETLLIKIRKECE